MQFLPSWCRCWDQQKETDFCLFAERCPQKQFWQFAGNQSVFAFQHEVNLFSEHIASLTMSIWMSTIETKGMVLTEWQIPCEEMNVNAQAAGSCEKQQLKNASNARSHDDLNTYLCDDTRMKLQSGALFRICICILLWKKKKETVWNEQSCIHQGLQKQDLQFAMSVFEPFVQLCCSDNLMQQMQNMEERWNTKHQNFNPAMVWWQSAQKLVCSDKKCQWNQRANWGDNQLWTKQQQAWRLSQHHQTNIWQFCQILVDRHDLELLDKKEKHAAPLHPSLPELFPFFDCESTFDSGLAHGQLSWLACQSPAEHPKKLHKLIWTVQHHGDEEKSDFDIGHQSSHRTHWKDV